MRTPLINIPEIPKICQEDWVLITQCDLTERFHEIQSYNHRTRNELGGEVDIEERLRLYKKLLTWREPPVHSIRVGQHELTMIFLKYAYPPPVQ